MTKRIEGMCPHCGWRYDVLLAHANSGLVPKHDHPTQEKAMCPGSDQGPRNPESDRRPLWKDLPNERPPTDHERKGTAEVTSPREPTQTRMLLVVLKKPVRLPICFLDAIKEGGIEKISAFDEAVDEQIGTTG